MSEVRITITDGRKPWLRWFRSTVSIIALCIGPIMIGVWAGSAAMQWFGFVFALFSLVGLIAVIDGRLTSKDMTIAEARDHIDKIERGSS